MTVRAAVVGARGRGVAAALLVACSGAPEPATPDARLEPSGPTAQVDWPPPGTAAARNALLIVIDTTRDDATRAAATPVLDQLAARGARVDRAWAGGTWTVPSVVSLLTGRFVRHHGWDHPSARMGRYPTLPEVERLPEVLRAAGVRTFGLYANPYLSEPLGFDRGFETWKRSSDKQMARSLQSLVQQAWSAECRHFAYVHILGPHSPLAPSEAARERWAVAPSWFSGKHGFMIGAAKRNQEDGVRAAYADAYHAVVEDTDALVGTLLDALGPHRADTLVVVTSDHGELLGEHDAAGHGWWLWEELTHVPLLVDHPAVEGPRERLPAILSNVATADLITRGLGISHRWPVGLSDAPLLAARRDGREAVALDGTSKVVWDDRITGRSPVVFDLAHDPHEAHPLAVPAAVSPDHAAFRARYPEPLAQPVQASPVDPETARELEVLGYVDD